MTRSEWALNDEGNSLKWYVANEVAAAASEAAGKAGLTEWRWAGCLINQAPTARGGPDLPSFVLPTLTISYRASPILTTLTTLDVPTNQPAAVILFLSVTFFAPPEATDRQRRNTTKGPPLSDTDRSHVDSQLVYVSLCRCVASSEHRGLTWG